MNALLGSIRADPEKLKACRPTPRSSWSGSLGGWTTSPRRIHVRAKRTAENVADRLGHEYRVFVRITVHQSPNALRLPISALFRREGTWMVYVVERGRARSQTVEIGQRNTSLAEVTKGLPEGASVILHPSDRVADGVRVVTRAPAATPR